MKKCKRFASTILAALMMTFAVGCGGEKMSITPIEGNSISLIFNS